MDKRLLVALDELSRLLHGGNYEVAFRAQSIPAVPGATARDYLQTLFGEPGDRRYQRMATCSAVVEDIESCLRHRGDRGYGPKLSVFRTRAFRQALGGLKAHLERLDAETTSIVSFAIASAYPIEWVWWEFAYLFVTPSRAEVFVGASSD